MRNPGLGDRLADPFGPALIGSPQQFPVIGRLKPPREMHHRVSAVEGPQQRLAGIRLGQIRLNPLRAVVGRPWPVAAGD